LVSEIRAGSWFSLRTDAPPDEASGVHVSESLDASTPLSAEAE
jgi:hypothetical protein